MKYFLRIVALLSILAVPAHAGTIYVDTAGANGGLATNSGSTDNTTPTASGTAATAAGTTVTLDVSTNLGATSTTPGPTQGTINIAGATNANRTIFWITGITSGCTGTAVACVITVDAAPTGVTTNSWSVGGRYLWPGTTVANVIEGAIGLSTAQDIVQFNTTPSTRTTGIYFTQRNSGTSTTGLLILRGKAGVSPKPKLELTANNSVINGNNLNNLKIENLELANNGASVIIANSGPDTWIDNVKISAGGGGGINTSSSLRITNSEITGLAGDAITSTTTNGVITGNYIHGNTGNGITITSTAPNHAVSDNIISANGGRGIYLNALATAQSHSFMLEGNTIANNTGVGFEVSDPDFVVNFRNNIFANANSAFIVSWAAGTAELFGSHGYNVFYSSSSGTLNNVTANSTESTANPSFTNAGSGDFSIGSSGSAAGAGYPGVPLGSTSTGYKDIGAIQRQVVAGGGSSGQLRPGIGQ